LAGSTIPGVNGVYARVGVDELPFISERKLTEEKVLFHNVHTDWYLALVEFKSDPKKVGKTVTDEWILVDQFRQERFTHKGNTYTLGSGKKWTHSAGKFQSESLGKEQVSAGSDEDELPWQVVFIAAEAYVKHLQNLFNWNEEIKSNALAGKLYDEDSNELRELTPIQRLAANSDSSTSPPPSINKKLQEENSMIQALEAQTEGRFEDAIPLYEDLLQRVDTILDAKFVDWARAEVQILLAKSLRHVRLHDSALQVLDEALSIFPNHKRALKETALLFLDTGNPSKARETLELLYLLDRNFDMLGDLLVSACANEEREKRMNETRKRMVIDAGLPSPSDSAEEGLESLVFRANHYLVLETAHDASSASIKKGYRKMSRNYHPDKTNGNAADFERVHEAYDVLSDEEKRKFYDCGGDLSENGDNRKSFQDLVLKKYFPEKFPFQPFGNPLENKIRSGSLNRNKPATAKPNEPNIPEGSYKTSCLGCSVTDDVLSCTHCQTGQHRITKESSIGIHACGINDSFGNVNGELKCEPKRRRSYNIPPGNYIDFCDECYLLIIEDTGSAELICEGCVRKTPSRRRKRKFKASLGLEVCINTYNDQYIVVLDKYTLKCVEAEQSSHEHATEAEKEL